MTTFTRFDIEQDPFELAKKGRVIAGTVLVKDLLRINDLVGDAGALDASLEFGIDDTGLRIVTGKVEGDVNLECQRCMGRYTSSLKLAFTLGLVKNESQIERLPDEYEPLLVEGDFVCLQDIIEDEIILALPAAPLHDEADCSQVRVTVSKQETQPQVVETRRPFGNLSDLLDKGKK